MCRWVVGSAGVATRKVNKLARQRDHVKRQTQTDHQADPGAGLSVHPPAVTSREPNLENVFEGLLFRVDGKRSRFDVSRHCLASGFAGVKVGRECGIFGASHRVTCTGIVANTMNGKIDVNNVFSLRDAIRSKSVFAIYKSA